MEFEDKFLIEVVPKSIFFSLSSSPLSSILATRLVGSSNFSDRSLATQLSQHKTWVWFDHFFAPLSVIDSICGQLRILELWFSRDQTFACLHLWHHKNQPNEPVGIENDTLSPPTTTASISVEPITKLSHPVAIAFHSGEWQPIGQAIWMFDWRGIEIGSLRCQLELYDFSLLLISQNQANDSFYVYSDTRLAGACVNLNDISLWYEFSAGLG